MSASTGSNVTCWYSHETNGFGKDPGSAASIPFGGDATCDPAEGSRNAVEVFEPDSRDAIQLIYQNFRGSWTASFVLTNPWWLKEALHDTVSTSGNDPDGDSSNENWTHTYDGEEPGSMRIVTGYTNHGKARVLKGCVVATMTVEAQVGGLVLVTLEGAYADEEFISPQELTAQPSLSHDAMTFAEARLDLAGEKLEVVQSATLTIENNIELVDALDSYTAVDYVPLQRTTTVDFEKVKTFNEGQLEDFYGGTGTTTVQRDAPESSMTYVFDNGASEAEKNTVQFHLGASKPVSYAEGGVGDPESMLTQQINRQSLDVHATATNALEAAK